MKENEYLSELSKRKSARIISWICLAIIAGLIIATLVTGIMGSKYFLGFLALCIVVPILMYVVLWMGKVLRNMGIRNITRQQEEAEKQESKTGNMTK